MTQTATTYTEAQEQIWDALIRSITWGKSDCETCPYEKECEQANPDFDANACKVN